MFETALAPNLPPPPHSHTLSDQLAHDLVDMTGRITLTHNFEKQKRRDALAGALRSLTSLIAARASSLYTSIRSCLVGDCDRGALDGEDASVVNPVSCPTEFGRRPGFSQLCKPLSPLRKRWLLLTIPIIRPAISLITLLPCAIGPLRNDGDSATIGTATLTPPSV